MAGSMKGLYHFEQARFTVDFEPEDWAGLEKRVENSSLADKEELLAIIRADEMCIRDRASTTPNLLPNVTRLFAILFIVAFMLLIVTYFLIFGSKSNNLN